MLFLYNKKFINILHSFSLLLSFYLILSFIPSLSLARPLSLDSDDMDFYLLTVEKRTEPHLMFGHSVIRIKDNTTGNDVVVNWGIFDFDDPNFLIKFLRGNLYYSVEAYNFRSQLISWKRQGSRVYQDKLNLSSTQKKLLLDKIETNLKPDNKYFIYSYFRKNCATYPRDYINDLLDGKLKEKLTDTDHITSFSYRKDSLMNLSLDPFVYMGVDLIFNSNTDTPISVWERMYKPSTLREVLLTEKNPYLKNSPPLLIEPSILVDGQIPTPCPITGFTIFAILFTLLILLSCVLKHKQKIIAYTKVLGLYSIGIGCFSLFVSMFFLFFWIYSYQSDCKHNVNLFLFWPTDFIYIILGIKLLFFKNPNISKYTSYYSLLHILSSVVLLILYIIGIIEQDISNVLLYIYPILIIFYYLILERKGKNVFSLKK